MFEKVYHFLFLHPFLYSVMSTQKMMDLKHFALNGDKSGITVLCILLSILSQKSGSIFSILIYVFSPE